MARRTVRVVQLLLLFSSCAAAQDRFPEINAETLAKTTVSLPKDATGRAAVVIFTFSKSAGNAAKQWNKALRAEFKDRGELAVYQVAVLEDVPRILRGVVMRGIRSGTPEELHNSFLVVLKEADALKTYAAYQRAEDPYLVVLDQQGVTIHRSSGNWSAEKETGIKRKITELLTPKREDKN
jgi:hypothetical protein